MRAISPTFIDALNDYKKPSLYYFKEKVKEDNSLILCFRENYINIYYNGGSLLRIEEKTDKKGKTRYYECKFDLNYSSSLAKATKDKYINKLNKNTINGSKKEQHYYIFTIRDGYKVSKEKAYYIINALKKLMDSYIDKDTIEAIAQQRLFADNFDATIEDGYLFLDREYTVSKTACPRISSSKSAKIDGIALKIENSKVKNITLVEVKSKFDACNGKTASIAAHKKDYEEIIKTPSVTGNIVEDAKFALKTYQDLGLLDDKKTYNIPNKFEKLFVFTDEIIDEASLRDYLSKSPSNLAAFDDLKIHGETKFIKYTL